MADDQNRFDHIPTQWLEENVERVFLAHEAIKDKYWRLENGCPWDWAFGDCPPPVPNRSMPWVRPSFIATAYRQWWFEGRGEAEILLAMRPSNRPWRVAA